MLVKMELLKLKYISIPHVKQYTCTFVHHNGTSCQHTVCVHHKLQSLLSLLLHEFTVLYMYIGYN